MEPKRNWKKTIIVWILSLGLFFLGYQLLSTLGQEQAEISYSEVLNLVEQDKVAKINIKGREIFGETKDRRIFGANTPEDPEFIKILREHNVQISVPKESGFSWLYLIFPIVLVFIFLVVPLIMMKRLGNMMGQQDRFAQQFSKSRAKLLNESIEVATFKDVAGIDEAVEEMREVVDLFRNPKKYTDIGARIPKGVLLIGPPGTGKTLLARAAAGEAGVKFYIISGSDFVEMFVGVGAGRVRDMFEEARKNAPCMVFIDEIDAIGRQRGTGLGGGHDEREQTLNQILVGMDGMESNVGVLILAATNRPDILDPALIRPGRFDKQIEIDNTGLAGREAILCIHAKKVKLSKDVDLNALAKATPMCSGAHLENIVQEAARLAGRKGKEAIEQDDLEEAQEKVALGLARPSVKISEEELNIIAHHEVGHAIVGTLFEKADPIKRVSIIPRGPFLGQTWQLPTEDRHLADKERLLSLVKGLLGGRAAEQVFLGVITNGASNDIERVTDIVRDMVANWGMYDEIGLMHLNHSHGNPFLGREFTPQKRISEETQREVDLKIREVINDAYEEVLKILRANEAAAKILVKMIREEETINGNVVAEVLEKNGVNKPNSL